MIIVLPARAVHVARFERLARRGDDVEVAVTCSSGTYVRALARDLGAALGVGAHLTALRRTRVGGFDLAAARTLDELAGDWSVTPLADALRAAFPCRTLTDDEVYRVARGQPIEPRSASGPVAALSADGTAVALIEERAGRVRSLAVFTPAG